MPHASHRQDLVDVYAKHPLREETILARIARQRGTLEGITELDLALDSLTEITDQNHVGGLASVVRLALRAGVGPASRVLDIGAGLGGSSRCLAYLFGCRVDAVDISPQRCREGRRLTERVGLEHLVTFSCGDILSVALPTAAFDVIWGQGAWMHIADTRALLERVARALASRGHVAFEEACLNKPPLDDAEAEALKSLERLWVGRFISRDAWQSALLGAGFAVVAIDDLTDQFLSHFEHLTAIAGARGATEYPAHETDAFGHATALSAAGVVTYARFVARR